MTMTVGESIANAEKSLENISPRDRFVSGMFFCFLQWLGILLVFVFVLAILGQIGIRGWAFVLTLLAAFATTVVLIWRSLVFHDLKSPVLKRVFQGRIGDLMGQIFDLSWSVEENNDEKKISLPDGASVTISYDKDIFLNIPLIVAGGPVGISRKGVHSRTYFYDLQGNTDMFEGKQYVFEIFGRDSTDNQQGSVRLTDFGDGADHNAASVCAEFMGQLKSLAQQFPLQGSLLFNRGHVHLRIYDLVKGINANGKITFGGISKKAQNRWKQKGHGIETLSILGSKQLLQLVLRSSW